MVVVTEVGFGLRPEAGYLVCCVGYLFCIWAWRWVCLAFTVGLRLTIYEEAMARLARSDLI